MDQSEAEMIKGKSVWAEIGRWRRWFLEQVNVLGKSLSFGCLDEKNDAGGKPLSGFFFLSAGPVSICLYVI